jgi:hypothetical protein
MKQQFLKKRVLNNFVRLNDDDKKKNRKQKHIFRFFF